MIDIQQLRKDPEVVSRRLAARGAGAFDANSIGTSGSDRGSDSDASDCGGMTLREAQQLVNKRRAEYPGRLDERFGSGMRVKTKLTPSSPLATIPSSPTIHRNRTSSSSGEGEGLAGPSPRSPLDRAAARDAHLEPDAAVSGSPKAAPRPATIASLTPAVSSDNSKPSSSPSPRTMLRHHHHHHHPFPGVIDEIAPAAACAASDRYVDIEPGVMEIIAREETAATTTTTTGGTSRGGDGGWGNKTRRIARRLADRRIPDAVWAAFGVLWLYAIARLVLGA